MQRSDTRPDGSTRHQLSDRVRDFEETRRRARTRAVFCDSILGDEPRRFAAQYIETLRAMLMAERGAPAVESEAQHRAPLIEKLRYIIRSCGMSSSGNPRSTAGCSNSLTFISVKRFDAIEREINGLTALSSVKFSIFRSIEGRPLLFEPLGI